MKYKLFAEYITLQSLLKTTGILHSGGAAKGFLAENIVLLNGEKEERRGKKIYVGDSVELPNQQLSITIVEPSEEERAQYKEDLEEKERVARIVKAMNKQTKQKNRQTKNTTKDKSPNNRPVRFPGT